MPARAIAVALLLSPVFLVGLGAVLWHFEVIRWQQRGTHAN